MSVLLESFDDGILTLTINRPEAHNSMNEEVAGAINAALRRAEEDRAIRCLVLTGTGKVFCAGGDVKVQASGDLLEDSSDPEAAHDSLVDMLKDGTQFAQLIYNFPKPTLAIMPGPAAGAGLALALACDFRFCLDTAKLTTAFAKLGLSSDSGLSFFLPRLVGATKARELCYFSDVISGSEALEIGLVNAIADEETFAEEARAYALRLASLPTFAIAKMKANLNASEYLTLGEACDLESENVARCIATNDHKRAAAAFFKKERVTFEGK